MNGRVVQAVAKATFREFWRTPEAVFWTYGFPLLMMIGLGLAFQPRVPPPVPIAVVRGEIEPAFVEQLRGNPRLEVLELDPDAADRALVRGRVGVIVRGSTAAPSLRDDPVRPESLMANLLVEQVLRDVRDGPRVAIAVQSEDRPGSRYIDFLVPGLLGLNLMGACMWGIGFNLVMMRTQNLLRRLFVTPMRRGDFLIGYMIGRGVLVIPEALVIALLGNLIWGVPIRGSLLALLAVVIVGGLAFTGLGCLCASRARTYEGIAGLMNLCQLPMWVLGGALFSNENMTGVMRYASEVLPLTHLTRAFRDLMLEPGGFAAVAWPLFGLTTFAVACFALALKLFRWD
ncbi:MAG: ABC transporter permease [Planctomycetes bacterium]|nr:ABC transporter permease [Planctomycetota bacterium]